MDDLDTTEPDDRPQEEGRRRRQSRAGGVRLVGIFVPWQAVALTLAVVVGLTAVVAARQDGGGTVRVEQASDDRAVTPEADPTTSTSQPPPESTTTTAAPPTTTTTQQTTTTTIPPSTTTTTSLQPGGAEVAVFSGEQGEGYCNAVEPDWGFFGCPYQGMRPEFTFSLNTSRYPASARYHLDVALTVTHDLTYCMRLYDLNQARPLAGSEKCWTSPAVAEPAPYQSWPPDPGYVGTVGPVTFTPGPSNYVLQTKMTRASTGQPCDSMLHCMAQLKRLKINIDWG